MVGPRSGLTENVGRGRLIAGTLAHWALVYESPAQLAAGVAPFLHAGLERGDRVVAAVRRECHAAVREALGGQGARLDLRDASRWEARPASRLVALRRMADALPRGAELRVVHEPRWDGPARSVREWARFEAIVNAILADVPLRLVCLYDRSSLSDDALAHACRDHPALLEEVRLRPSERYRAPERYLDREWPGAA